MKRYLQFILVWLVLFLASSAVAMVPPLPAFDHLYLYKDGQKITDDSITVYKVVESDRIDIHCSKEDCGVFQAYKETQKLEIRKSSDSSFVAQIEIPAPRDYKSRGNTMGLSRYFDVDIETGKVVEDKSRYYFEKIKKDKISILGFSAISILILGGLFIRKRRLKRSLINKR